MSSKILKRMRRQSTTALGTVLVALMSCGLAAADDRNDRDDAAHRVHTDTPIKHLIVLIGENRTFDHIFATISRSTASQPAVKGHHSAERRSWA